MKSSKAFALVVVVSALFTIAARSQEPPAGPPLQRRVRPPAPALSGDRADIEMNAKEGIPIVAVTVNGQGPYRFGIDTGAPGFAHVSTRVATELALKPVGEIITGDPSGKNQRALPVYMIDKLRLGNLTFTGVSAPQLALADDLDGMLGLELFENLLLTMDYGRARLIAARGELPAVDDATVLSYTPGPGGSAQVPIRIGEFETALHLDTGAARTGIALPLQKVARVATRNEPRVVGRARTLSQELEVSSVELAVPVTFGKITLPVTSVSFPSPDPVGVIGSDALRTMAVTIDQQNRRVRIVPSEAQ
jgi:hypothetical protein